MLEYYHRLDGNKFQNVWEGLLLSASVDNKGDVIGLQQPRLHPEWHYII